MSTPDTWEAIKAQLDYWQDMDNQYWRQRKETEYTAWFERTYGVKPKLPVSMNDWLHGKGSEVIQ